MRTFTIADGDQIHVLDWTPNLSKPFIWFRMKLREIRDIHETHNGIQIELYPSHNTNFDFSLGYPVVG